VVVSISAGKTRTAYVTDQGDTYVWETRPPKGEERGAGGGGGGGGGGGSSASAGAGLQCEPVRLDGVKRVCQVGLMGLMGMLSGLVGLLSIGPDGAEAGPAGPAGWWWSVCMGSSCIGGRGRWRVAWHAGCGGTSC
jgi:hypothetical protein